jgi:hypothetical protein
MAQWANQITVDGARFLPHVSTARCFDSPTCEGIITSIFVVDDGGDAGRAEQIADRLNEQFVDKPYPELLAAYPDEIA